MRLAHLQASRPPWYDRNSIMRGETTGYPAQAPHGATVLHQYTVPSNRKFMLETASIITWRDTAAGVAGLVHNYYAITGSASSSLMPNAIYNNNTVQFRLDYNVPLQAIMIAADTLQAITEDVSFAGTTSAYFSYKGTEFDAQ